MAELLRTQHFTWEWQIETTQDDIERGIPGNPDCCMVALAAKRALEPKNYLITVTGDIHLYPQVFSSERIVWLGGREACTDIAHFDSVGLRSLIKPRFLSFFLK
jgi:hypothetical protein